MFRIFYEVFCLFPLFNRRAAYFRILFFHILERHTSVFDSCQAYGMRLMPDILQSLSMKANSGYAEFFWLILCVLQGIWIAVHGNGAYERRLVFHIPQDFSLLRYRPQAKFFGLVFNVFDGVAIVSHAL